MTKLGKINNITEDKNNIQINFLANMSSTVPER